MPIPVGQLVEHLAKRDEGTIIAKLGSLVVNDDATLLNVGQHHFSLDESANHALAKYLGIPKNYLEALTPDFRAVTLRYWFDRKSEVDTSVESVDGTIVAIHQSGQVMLPMHEVGEVITKVLQPEDTIRRILRDEKHFHIDATTSDHIIGWANPEGDHLVGDITEGGLRILGYPYQSKSPSVSTYIERLVCRNGMCTEETLGKISLKGRTVSEVIAEMEIAANLVLEQLDDQLTSYAETRSMMVPGSPQAFAAQLAREANVNRKVLDAVLDVINQLPEPVSVWSVNQAFTSVANQVETYATMTKLQSLGGSLAFEAEKMVTRCGSCERLL